MTTTLPEPRDVLRDYLAQAATRSALGAFFRHRGLPDEADDLVQAVCCEALAADHVPSSAKEVPLWVSGIARHKLVDEHRRRSRYSHGQVPETPVHPSPDAALVLQRITADLGAAEHRSLSHLFREHAGESLLAIASEQQLEPETLRQRLCRLRRSIRARYAVPALLGVALVGAIGLRHELSSPPAAHAPALSVQPYTGRWHVVEISPVKYGAQAVRVEVLGDRVKVFGPGDLIQREYVVTPHASGKVMLSAGSRFWDAEVTPIGNDRVKISTAQGYAILARDP